MRNADSRISRKRLIGSLLVIAALIGSVVGVGNPVQARVNGGVMFGASVGPTRQRGLAETEAQLGRQLDLIRVFESWDNHAPKAYWTDVLEEGRTMLISVRSKRKNGSRVNWRQIADAQPGSQLHNEMVAWAQSMRNAQGEIWFTFQHEPEITENLSNGNSSDFKAAWRKFVSIMRANNANVKYAWIMSSWSYQVNSSDRRSASKWYPGDDVVDFIGADPYNWSNCRENDSVVNRSMAEITESFRQFGQSHPNKGLILGEWAATDFRNSGTKAGWINDVRALFKTSAWSQLAAVAYYNAHDPKFPRCTWEIDSSTSALNALKAMANDPFYNPLGGAPAPNPDPDPAPGGNPNLPPGPAVGPRQSLMTGRVNSSNQGHARWVSTTFTAAKSGSHVFKMWHQGGTLDADIRSENGAWVGVLGGDLVTRVNLSQGQRYQVAIWAKSGEGLFEMNVYAPR